MIAIASPRSPFLGQVRLAGQVRQVRPASGPLLGRPALRGSSPVIVTDASFAGSGAMTAPKAIVDFWSPGCPYCVEFKPIFEDVSASSDGSILMVEANVDADAVKTATDFKIAGLPGIVFLSNGKEVGRVEGMMSKPDFLMKIAQVFGSGAGGPGLAPGSAGSASAASGISGAGILSGIALAGVLGGVIWGLTKVVKF